MELLDDIRAAKEKRQIDILLISQKKPLMENS